jgi:alpha-mannosidase
VNDGSIVDVTLVPHTHWDREWYEPFSVFSDRLVAMMDTLLDLGVSRSPHFHLDGQTAMIDDYLARRPERGAELSALVRSGQLSAGPWVTQMDEFLTSGESHIRNLETGLARARDLGRPLEVGYMPDQFGHIGQMPQILGNGGIDRAMVWRGVPREIDRSAFRWRAPDGTEVITEYMMAGYFSGASLGKHVSPDELATALERSVDSVRPFLVGDRSVIMVGYDHAGPDASLAGRLADAQPFLRTIRARIAGLAAAIDGAPPEDELPVWTGELRSSARAHLLPNVYSARVHQKRERGRLESLLERYAEPLAALVPGVAWPGAGLDRAWTLMLWNGAHDSVCGCSHDQVAIDVDERSAAVRDTAESIVGEALSSLARSTADAGVLRFNPSPFEREGVPPLGYAVSVPRDRLVDEPVPIEPTERGIVADGLGIVLLDEPDVGDLYTFCGAATDQVPSAPERVEVAGSEAVASWPGLRVVVRVARRAQEPFLRLRASIHNERPDHRLRLHVELSEPVDSALAGAPFELVRRPLVGEGGEVEAASATWPARHLVAAGSAAVLHEGVFEYEVVGGEELATTLLRCVGRISAEELATRPWAAGPQTPTPMAQMIGRTDVALALWPDPPSADPAALLAGWERFALPIVEASAPGGGDLRARGSLIDLESGGAQLSGIRKVGGAPEIRLWNPWSDRSVDAVVAGRPLRLDPARIETVGRS